MPFSAIAPFIGPAISAIGSFASTRATNRVNRENAENANALSQENFERVQTQSVQDRVGDAKAAGISPLAALGMPGQALPSVAVPPASQSPFGNAARAAVESYQALAERKARAETRQAELALANQRLDLDRKRLHHNLELNEARAANEALAAHRSKVKFPAELAYLKSQTALNAAHVDTLRKPKEYPYQLKAVRRGREPAPPGMDVVWVPSGKAYDADADALLAARPGREAIDAANAVGAKMDATGKWLYESGMQIESLLQEFMRERFPRAYETMRYKP